MEKEKMHKKSFIKDKLKVGALLLVCIIMCFVHMNLEVNAVETDGINTSTTDTSKPTVLISSYQVTNDKIVPGEDFTLVLSLVNCSSSVSVKNLLIDINYPKGVAPVYGTTAQQYIQTMSPQEKVDVSFSFTTWTTIDTDSLDFTVYLLSAVASNDVVLRIPCGSDSPFSILSAGIPSAAVVNENVETALAFKVLGNENVSNVNVLLNVNGSNVATNYIGIVTPGASKTQTTSLTFDRAGEYLVDMQISYTDSFGMKQYVLVNSQTITISEKSSTNETPNIKDFSTNDDTNNDKDNNSGSNNLLVMGICGILIVLIGFVVVALVYHKKR